MFELDSVNAFVAKKGLELRERSTLTLSRVVEAASGEIVSVRDALGGVEDLSEDVDGDFGFRVGEDDLMIGFERLEDAVAMREFANAAGFEMGEVAVSTAGDFKGASTCALVISASARDTRPEEFRTLLGALQDGITESTFDRLWAGTMVELDEKKGNPYHAAPDPSAPPGSVARRGGQFVSKKALASAGKGSFSIPRKPKMRIKGKAKNGGLKMRAVNRKCGRPARAAGQDMLCYTGKGQKLRQKLRRMAKSLGRGKAGQKA